MQTFKGHQVLYFNSHHDNLSWLIPWVPDDIGFAWPSTSRWRHQMETFSALLTLCEENPPVTGGFPSQRPATRSFDVFFDLRLNKRLSKESWRRWFETPPCSLWRHSNDTWWLLRTPLSNGWKGKLNHQGLAILIQLSMNSLRPSSHSLAGLSTQSCFNQ